MNHYYEIAKHELYKSAIMNIETDITLPFLQNMEHNDNYICSTVEYNGKTGTIVFYDMRQFKIALFKLADYFYVNYRRKKPSHL